MMSLRSATRAAAVAATFTALLGLAACTDSNPAVLGANPDGTSSTVRGGAVDSAAVPPNQADLQALPAAGAPSPERHTGPQGVMGQFVTDCSLSHSSPDDPILHPDVPQQFSTGEHAAHGAQTGSAQSGHGADAHSAAPHMHNFFGNTTTDSSSTLATLLEGQTTCKKKLDTAAYWAPQLSDHGSAVVPTKSTAYYRAAPSVDPKSLQAFPPGLKIVAGDANATAQTPQDPDTAGWGCGTSSTLFPTPPDCPASAPLRAVITFPDCWDGINVDSADHRSHMANSSGGLCPATHPVHVPQLTFAITYPISGTGHDLSLASGGVNGLHSDFINSWHQSALQQEIDLCLHRNVTCSLSSNRGEESLFTG